MSEKQNNNNSSGYVNTGLVLPREEMDDLMMEYQFETLAIHADQGVERTADVAPPIHVSTTYEANPENLVYSRAHTASRRRLEKILGDLEGQGHAVTYPCGMACTNAILVHLKPKRVFIAPGGYFGVHNSLRLYTTLINSYAGSAFEAIDLSKLEAEVEKHQASSSATTTTSESAAKTTNNGEEVNVFANEYACETLIWLETPKNPTSEMQDIEYYANLAKKLGNAKVIVDSTFATPVLQKPFLFGADYVMHSSSKYFGGHSDLTGGVIVTKDCREAETLREERNIMGVVLGNFETWLLLRSLRTLNIRVLQQSKTATEVAQWLYEETKREGSHLKKVHHPSLKEVNPKDYELCQKQMGGKAPAVLSIELDTPSNAQQFPKLLKIVKDATSLGGYETLIDYRYKWDPFQPPTLLRVSIGLESSVDIIQDFKNALNKL